jgi:hypothetical protein
MTSQVYGMNSAHTLQNGPTLQALNPVEFKTELCRLTAAQVMILKALLIERYRTEGHPGSLIREAIATAEAQAWLTGFPQLFLPELTDEIVRQLRQKWAPIHPEYAQAA